MVAKFKSFVQSPPITGTLIFREKQPPNLGHAQPIDAGLRDSTNYQFYLTRWQSNAFLFRPLKDNQTDYENIGNSASIWRWEDNHWLLKGNKALLWVSNPTLPLQTSGRMVHNSTQVLCDLAQRQLALLLNMGIYNVDSGSVKWTNDACYANFAERGQIIQGLLSLRPNGQPEKLSIKYQTGAQFANYVIRYFFETNVGPSYVPNTIQVMELIDGKEVERNHITIVSLKLHEPPAVRDIFDPSPAIASNRMTTLYYTNAGLYRFDVQGRLTKFSGDVPVRTLPWRSFFFYAVVGSVGVGFILIHRVSVTTNKQQRKEV